MRDLIDRNKALSFPFANGKYDHEHADEHFIAGCEAYKEWLETLSSAGSGWISCSEQMPQDGEIVIFTHIFGNVEVGKYIQKKKQFIWRWDIDFPLRSTDENLITAWMPFPRRFKEDNNNE